jgi:sialate O-acetylesterase
MKTSTLLFASIIAALPVAADVRLPKIFTDHMMLQRDLPVRIWGWAEPGEAVSVELGGKTAKSKSDRSGAWKVELPSVKSGENLELVVNGKNRVVIKDIIFGDIWVCSGQSNMEMALGPCLGAGDDIKAANLPQIRRIKFNRTSSGSPEADASPSSPWQVCSPATAPGFTAVGFYFAREVQLKTGVPIGIIDTNWGGTRIEPWVANDGLEKVAELKAAVAAKREVIQSYQRQLPAALQKMEGWIAETKGQLAKGAPTGPPPAIPAVPDAGWSGLYNAMVNPIVQLPIKGALWYQGEGNGNEGVTYYDKMRALIGGWRSQWKQGDFPFYFVQLANFQAVNNDPAGGNGWAKIREAQNQSLSIPNTGMAVIIDTVPLAQAADIHPKNKYDVGMRLARWALGRDYQQNLEVSGPLFKALKIEAGKARVAFDHLGGGLMVAKKEGRDPAVEAQADTLRQFAIAGADKQWFWADAIIDKDTVIVSSPEVKEPVAVRYAFQMNPDGANLYNREGLPASPFRTDDW